MKKSLMLLIVSFMLTSSAFADSKIAIVDLQQLVSNSSQVKQLKQEHDRKIKELDKIIVNARGEISNEKDPAKILLLEEKYMKEFHTKKDDLERYKDSKFDIDDDKYLVGTISKYVEGHMAFDAFFMCICHTFFYFFYSQIAGSGSETEHLSAEIYGICTVIYCYF